MKRKMLGEYLWMKRQIFLFVFLGVVIYAFVGWLYGEAAETVLYQTFLWILFTGGILLAGFPSFCRKTEQLKYLKSALDEYLAEFPEAENKIEERYQEIMIKMEQIRKKMQEEQGNRYDDLNDYYSMWVHQIKTPIAAMGLLLEEADPKQRPDLSLELFKIESYVEMVTGYLRTESLGGDWLLKEQDLDSMIRQAVKKYAKMFISKKISLSYEPVSAQVLTDEKWLVFVLEQILSNGLKYTGKGQISIYLEDEILVIEDTGIGIEKEDLPRIFEKGYTGRNGRTDKKATGIGLYLVKKIMDKLGHGIWIESEVSKGTKVYLDLRQKKLEMI